MGERREERGRDKSHTSSDVQPELARLGELPQTGAQAQEGVAADAGCHVGYREADVVDLLCIVRNVVVSIT